MIRADEEQQKRIFEKNSLSCISKVPRDEEVVDDLPRDRFSWIRAYKISLCILTVSVGLPSLTEIDRLTRSVTKDTGGW